MSLAELVLAILDKNAPIIEGAFDAVALGRDWGAAALEGNGQNALLLEICYGLLNSPEIMPDDVCAEIDAPSGSPYSLGAHRLIVRQRH